MLTLAIHWTVDGEPRGRSYIGQVITKSRRAQVNTQERGPKLKLKRKQKQTGQRWTAGVNFSTARSAKSHSGGQQECLCL